MAKQWSKYQQAIFDQVATGRTHIVVEALAGSGKTSTIVEAVQHVPKGQSVLLCAFNKRIAEELTRRIPSGNVTVKTTHSLGLGAVTKAWGRVRVDADRIDGYVDQRLPEDALYETRSAVCRLVSLSKNCWAKSEADVVDLASQFGIFCKGATTEELASVVMGVLEDCRKRDGTIDFDDMIWLPCVLELSVSRFDVVFVDETQDLNLCQLHLVRAAAGPEGRIIAVGDRHQAIYRFRGADAEAMPRMIQDLQAEVLPLSVTYRCPRKVVEQARTVVPELEAWGGAEEGEVIPASKEDMQKAAGPGDFVLSRLNAPLAPICLGLLKAGIRATIQGRDIGRTLATLVRNTNTAAIPQMVERLEEVRDRETRRLQKAKRNGSALDVLNDKLDTVIALAEGCATTRELLDRLERLFTDDGPPRVVCSTVHKAKGLEADRVWMLTDTFRKGRGEEESNIWYVAVTRARRSLMLVSAAPAGGGG